MGSADATHALWRPGVGLALWFTGADGAPTAGPDPDALPTAVADVVRGRILRRQIRLASPTDVVTAASLTLGPTAALALLDEIETRQSGELGYYRYLVCGIRAFVDAGSVTPRVEYVADAFTVRWAPLPTPRWRTWTSQAYAAAPPTVFDNGGIDAVDDYVREMTDLVCRRRCAGITPGAFRSPVIRALLPIDGVTDPGWIGGERGVDAAQAWSDWADGVRDSDSRLVLRLHEPDAPDATDASDALDERWRLQICQRTPDGDAAVDISRLDPADLDAVTTEVAHAVRVFPPLAAAGHDRHTLDFLLPTETVGELLDTGATALGDAGILLLLPRTLAEVTPTVSLRGRTVGAATTRSVLAGLDEIRDFQWQLAIGDAVLTDDELFALAEQKSTLVRLRGVWVRATDGALNRSARFIATQRALAESGHPADMGELFGLLADGADRLGVPVSSVDGLSWLDDIAAHGHVTPTPRPAPESLAAELRPYQQRGLEWLAHLASLRIGAVLADDMGLGKTVQVIALLCSEIERAEANDDGGAAHRPAPTLIVCPMSVVGNWEREIGRFAPHLRVLVHHGAARHRVAQFPRAVANVDVVVTTFAIATRDTTVLRQVPWHRVVVDEAQHIKNVTTAAAKAVRSIGARHRVALTGTPVENRLEDLRAVIDLVNPGLLGSPSAFKARFAAVERERDPVAVQRLSSLTSPFILRRVKTDPTIVADLPDKSEFAVRANLTVEQAALYRAVTDDLMAALGRTETSETHEGHRVRTVLAALTRLKQVCNHPAHFLADGSPLLRRNAHRSGKLELLADIVDTIVAEDERALIFTQFAAFGEMLAPWLAGRVGADIPFLHGRVPRVARDAIVERFADDEGPPVLIASLKAGGTGLNLTAANHVVHIDRWWNPAVENQATDRVHRIGQTRSVQVRTFVCVGTVEERIDAMITDKRALTDLTVTAGEHWLADIDDERLYDLMRLRDDAVGE